MGLVGVEDLVGGLFEGSEDRQPGLQRQVGVDLDPVTDLVGVGAVGGGVVGRCPVGIVPVDPVCDARGVLIGGVEQRLAGQPELLEPVQLVAGAGIGEGASQDADVVDGDRALAEQPCGHGHRQQLLGQLGPVLRGVLGGPGALAQPVGRRVGAIAPVGLGGVHHAEQVGVECLDAGADSLGQMQRVADFLTAQRRGIGREQRVEFGVDGRQIHVHTVSNICSFNNPRAPAFRFGRRILSCGGPFARGRPCKGPVRGGGRGFARRRCCVGSRSFRPRSSWHGCEGTG